MNGPSVVYFYSPPGWPSAAPGVLPPAGWQPDPSFPAPPPGWVFYRNAAGFPVDAPAGAWRPTALVAAVPGAGGGTVDPARVRGKRLGIHLVVGLAALALVVTGAWVLQVRMGEPVQDVPTGSRLPTPTSVGDYGTPDRWQLSLEGFGPLRLGMTAYEGVETGGFKLVDYCDVGALEWTGRYDSEGDRIVVANLDESGHVWEINIYGTPSPLDNGIGLGDPAERVFEAYGNRLVADSRNMGAGGRFAVNGKNAHLNFVLDDGVVSTRNGISLRAGNVAPKTITNVSNCKRAWRE